ncbi:MAG: FAD-binding oxidoreductase [Gammaproteobacteria bacterium]|jgi:glycine/D-amino acid oxidase-like deaminating enzyme|nr:fructosyl-amino acid oxidase [Gammaproteobacteria bacterium]MBQ08880.1 fructosyl-amino acid oxidase [Gammaproteobacteria bacterium]MDP6146367.1 FAD-binding oxidoreductase [Gammaproteobacteria bacterium]HJL80759.1 FAD-binding oxidoreductase [Gammaproteobacteria bacterium]HJM09682.1 FAD-binding oxidoreductase [Gammaproteobacteria bacterium]|tara:strand:- start:13130 stop:14323 length:1194 start_codon:yes stop_codon:yes gene_type:complete
MDRRTFTKLIGLLAMPSGKSFGKTLKNTNIVVIGAGILGTMIAYELIKRGSRVTLIDKNYPASGASGNSFSWINATYPKKPYSYNLLSQLGIDAYRSLEKEFHFDIKWNGSLEWFKQSSQQKNLVAEINEVKKYPTFTPVDLISKSEAKRMEPNVYFGNKKQIAYSKSDGALDTVQAIQMIQNKFERLGGESIFPCEFLKLNQQNGKIKSIETNQGTIETNQAVFASGINTDKNLGLNISSTPTPGIILRTAPVDNRFNRIIVGPGVHIHQQKDGVIVLGEQGGAPLTHIDRLKERPSIFPSKEFEQMHTERIINTAKKFTSGLENIHVNQVSIGWRPLPKDRIPIIGRIKKMQGVYVSMMHSGISLAAIVSKLISEELLENKNIPILDHFRPSRFG